MDPLETNHAARRPLKRDGQLMLGLGGPHQSGSACPNRTAASASPCWEGCCWSRSKPKTNPKTTMSGRITEARRERSAYIHIRQPALQQVHHNLESNRRQHALRERATTPGFSSVVVVDDDLGISGAGTQQRPGFSRLPAAVCNGGVGAVFALEASRPARSNRGRHHLIDLRVLTRTLVVDPAGIPHPRLPSDRLLLGLKGTMSGFELGLLRQRAREACREKALRGEVMARVAGAREQGTAPCLTFAGLRVEKAVAETVPEACQPLGAEASLLVLEQSREERDQKRQAPGLALGKAKCEAGRARRQDDAADPENRPAAAELESRWNAALVQVAELGSRLDAECQVDHTLTQSQRERLTTLGADLRTLWSRASTPIGLKKRVPRTCLKSPGRERDEGEADHGEG